MALPRLLEAIGVADAPSWHANWQQRLGTAAAGSIDPRLLWTWALPLLSELELRCAQDPAARPVLGLTAPVGAGKTTLARQLQQLAALIGLRLAVASIDDAYHCWPERQRLLAGNPFGVNRVPPGSHDPSLLLEAIGEWRQDRGGELTLPRFDKTLRQGQGDRAMPLTQQADALLLEGWLVGYAPCGAAAISTWLNAADQGLDTAERAWLPHWDGALSAYQPLWAACDSCWVLEPLDWSVVLRWRLQAEAQQRRHGGMVMPPAAIKNLVRASLASLPPALYQGALQARARAVAQLDRRRRCIAVQVP